MMADEVAHNLPEALLLVHKQECLHCTHLVGSKLGTTTEPCDEDPHCPAQFAQIRLGRDMNVLVAQWASAMTSPDSSKLTRLLQSMEGMDDEVIQIIHSKAKEQAGRNT